MNDKTNKVGTVAPRGPSEQNVGSTDSVAPPAQGAPAASSVPESDEVKQARLAQKRRQRQDALDNAAKLCGDLRNSCEAIAAYSITGHTDVVRQHYAIYRDRVKNLHTILSAEIENLPEL
jgi:hypothetical protein